MRYRNLLETGLFVSLVSLNVMNIHFFSNDDAIRHICCALELGIDTIDTAEVYTLSYAL